MPLNSPSPQSSPTPDRHFLWDLHTRLFHWLLVLLFTGLLITGLADNLDWMVWHQRLGYCMLGLLIFRLLTGIWGRDYAHFSRFPLHPSAVIAQIGGRFRQPGHSPLGSWMIVLMLLGLVVQTISGLLNTDEIFVEGPWVFWADDAWIDAASYIHANTWILLLVLAVVHVLVVLGYLILKRQNLISPMLSGYASRDKHSTAAPESLRMPRWRLLATALVAGLAAWGIIELPG